jgi:hypothetical protein
MADPITTIIGLILAGNWTVILIFLAVLIIVTWLLGALFLMVGLGAVGGKHRELGSVMVTVLVGAVLGWIPCLGCILYWYFIKTRHETSWGGAIAAWFIAWIIPLAIVLLLGLFVLFPILIGP